MNELRDVDERRDGAEAEGGMVAGGTPAPLGTPAERKLAALQSRFEEVNAALDRTRGQLDAAERRGRIDQALVESGAADLEAARLLTEAAVARMDEADVELAVDELRRGRPYLFRRRDDPASSVAGAGGFGGAMAARPRGGDGEGLEDAAEAAAVSGDRRDLLRYLRLRRKG